MARDLEVGFLTRGVTFEFPVGIDNFWEMLEELHDEVEAELGEDDDDE